MAKQTVTSLLKLERRPCQLRKGLNGRWEEGGDDGTPACDITVEGLMLDRDELDALLGIGAHHALFVNKRNSGMVIAEPSDLTKRLKALVLADKFVESEAKLYIGMDFDEITLQDVTIAKISIEPQTGGLCAVSMQLQAHATKYDVGTLYVHQGDSIEAAIRVGKKDEGKNEKQKDLPLAPKSTVAIMDDNFEAAH